MRYAPNQTPDNVQGNDFFGSEFQRIKEALRNIEADGLTVFKGSPPSAAFYITDTSAVIRDVVSTNPLLELLANTGVRQGIVQAAATNLLLAHDVNSSTVTLRAKNGSGTNFDILWSPLGGTTGAMLSLNGKNAIEAGDAYLRLNQQGNFASGVFTPNHMRADQGYFGNNDTQGFNATVTLGGTYGNVQTIGAGSGGWTGFNAANRVSFMHDGTAAAGIYDIVNAKWLVQATFNAEVALYFNGVSTAKTMASNFLVHDGTVFRRMLYDSGQVAISGATTGTVTHSLGYHPLTWTSYLECTMAELGYTIGDRVQLPATISSTTAAGIVCWSSATQFGYIRNATVQLPHKTTGTGTAITQTSWRLRFTAAC